MEAEMLRDSGGEIEVANGEEPAGDAPGAGRGYYKIELRDQDKTPYGKAYHTKSQATAKALAEKIAHDRKAEIITIEANIQKPAAAAVAEKSASFRPNDKPPMLEVPALDENGEIVD
ncbi:MAG: hypothetical protein WCK00_08610 [Deltaproteobacteria bacterium]